MNLQEFVVQHGQGIPNAYLAHLTGHAVKEIARLRAAEKGTVKDCAERYAIAFAHWHGRPPSDADWPAPCRVAHGYQWLPPEECLLVELVGRVAPAQIASTLTARLRQVTGNPKAARSEASVLCRMARLGLVTADVVGGLTVRAAGSEIGSETIVRNAIRAGELDARRAGRLLVIPYADWEAWKKTRQSPPPGLMPLNDIKASLGIRSDKLSEYARMGLVPGAQHCRPYGTGERGTGHGRWYIHPMDAARLIADRRAGRPMPWSGAPVKENLLRSFALWQQRRHPVECVTCREIWGEAGAPESFETYVRRYPSLAHGAKRHLTLPWCPGLTVQELAERAGVDVKHVLRAIKNGTLDPRPGGEQTRITKAEATRWIQAGRQSGDAAIAWFSLQQAAAHYDYAEHELEELIQAGRLQSKRTRDGAGKELILVSRRQCARLREVDGYTERQAAAKAGLTIEQLRVVLEGVQWRRAAGIPLATVQAVIKRVDSHRGRSIEDAAWELERSPEWVSKRIREGLITVRTAPWAPDRPYITDPMFERLRITASQGVDREPSREGWLRLAQAAAIAGVSASTLLKWNEQGLVAAAEFSDGNRYWEATVRHQARAHWASRPCRRTQPPAWLRGAVSTGPTDQERAGQ